MNNVCFLFGINGVGKSTIAERLCESLPDAVHVCGSDVLRRALGGVTRATLERMPAEDKHVVLRNALLGAFQRYDQARLIVCDTHLVVPIRDGADVRYERMWDEAYRPLGAAFCNVVASCEDVLQRRVRDEQITGRKRHLGLRGIVQDMRANDEAFCAAFVREERAYVVANTDGVSATVRRLLRKLPTALIGSMHTEACVR